jgi:hypothetical protein
LSLWVQAR